MISSNSKSPKHSQDVEGSLGFPIQLGSIGVKHNNGMTPEKLNRLVANGMMLLVSAGGFLAGCYYIYCGIEFVLTH